MKKSRIYLLFAVFTVIGFVLGLAFEGIVGKAYAKTETPATKLALPEGAAFESVATGTARSADYEIWKMCTFAPKVGWKMCVKYIKLG